MRVGEDQEEVWVCAFLGLVFGQVLLVLVAQSALVLLVHLYPILPSKPPLIVCNTTHTRTHRKASQPTLVSNVCVCAVGRH